jgi:predicted nucleic acid-binding protein
VILDASAVIGVLTGQGQPATIDLLAESPEFHAPQVLDVEVLSALRRHARRGELSDERATAAVRHLAGLPIERYPHDLLVPRIWSLRHNFSSYDASYVALAEGLGGLPILTADGRFARAIQAHTDLEPILYS